jgi:hypothetical protein
MFKIQFYRFAIKTLLLGSSTLILELLLPTSLTTSLTRAVELGNGRTFFDHPPQLIQVTATTINPFSPSTYLFTISVPGNAGEPLQAVTIAQQTNVEQIDFQVSESRAFMGKNIASGQSIALASIGGSEPSNSNEVTIVFDKPVTPGSTVTIALAVTRNPDLGGVYQFGVTAFSPGENSPGLYLGSGRLQFISR